MERAVATVDLSAITQNVVTLRSRSRAAGFMAVVKADGYGHGMLPAAVAARAGGADYLGVALPTEAEQLRAAGDSGPILCWLYTPGDDLTGCVAQQVDVSVASLGMLAQVLAAVRATGRRVRLHAKVDTGLGRNGCAPADWPELLTAISRAVAGGLAEFVGVWSHLACADEPGSPVTPAQVAAFEEALVAVAASGLEPELRHLAASGGIINEPATHYDLVRSGISVYGLTPGPATGTSAELGLLPAMSVRAAVALVKQVAPGHGISYGHRYHTDAATTLALIPTGYADGLPRVGSGRLPIGLAGRTFPVAGTIAMDQVVLDVGDTPVQAGDPADLFGTGADGEPTADDWAAVCGTINYEIVTRLGNRVPRRYVGGAADGTDG